MKLLALDYGERRTGTAFGLKGVIETGPVIEAEKDELISELEKVCRAEAIDLVLIGLSEGVMAQKTRKFAKKLVNAVKLPVEFIDETLTSWEAERLKEDLAKPKGVPVDSLAAALVLKRYYQKGRRLNV